LFVFGIRTNLELKNESVHEYFYSKRIKKLTKYLHFGFDLEHYLLSENEILSIQK